MPEQNQTNNLETEIAELTERLEEKKRLLEQNNHIVPEKQTVSEALAEHFYPTQPVQAVQSDDDDDMPIVPIVPKKPALAKTADYLDALAPVTIEAINSYISMIPTEGIRQTISRVQAESPYLIDVFHDALVTRMYDELKARGIVA